MALRIITDSASDIRQGEFEGLSVAPLSIAFGDRTYRDGVDLTGERFYEMLVESEGLPTTGQVTPYGFSSLLEQVLAPDDEAVIITLSSKLSGTYQSACAAAAAFGERVRVVDSLSVCLGERILVEYALRLAVSGATASEVVSEVEARKGSIRLIALLDTLEYLRKGGRVSGLSASLGTMLSIKPVIAVESGEVVVLGKARGSKNGRNLLNEQIDRVGGADYDLPIALGYSGLSSSLLQKYIRDSRSLWESQVDDLPVVMIGSTVGTHAGPGAIGVAFFSRR